MEASHSQTRFANPAVAVQSWYVAARSRSLCRNKVRSIDMLNRRIVLYRDSGGRARALDARCGHLGADLSNGRVVGDGVQCPFHHWCWGADGACLSAPQLRETPARRIRGYPTQERWGLVWMFNGPAPAFELPSPPAESPFRVLRLPGKTIRCHPHLVIANGLDASHLDSLPGVVLSRPAVLSAPRPHQLSLEIVGRPKSLRLQRWTGTTKEDFVAVFSTLGGNLAWLEVSKPYRFYVLFTGRATADGGCATQTLLFCPRGTMLSLPRYLAFLYVMLHDDHRALNGFDFHPGFTEADAPLEAFVSLVNRMEIW
jgi:nitrite reductase/ring-hydroxylating ferredoxin subunit